MKCENCTKYDDCRTGSGLTWPCGAYRPKAGGDTDIEKLIEGLKTKDFERDYDCTPFECGAFGLLDNAATALSTFQAENEKLRADLEYEREHANAYYEECGQWEAENEKLRAENIRWGQVASEQDKAIDNLRKELEWKDMVIELAQRKQQEAEAALRREQE